MTISHSDQAKLFEIADRQCGFFTAKQAESAGFSSKHHYRWIADGRWIREGRGIYRLAFYPLAARPDLMRRYLWSRNREDEPQGVFSHDTALSIYDLSDLNPPSLHMTLPTGYRKRSPVSSRLRLYHADLPPSDLSIHEGVPVTTPERTILDLIVSNRVEGYILLQAVAEAFERGVISSIEQLTNHPMVKCSSSLRCKLDELLEWYEEAI